MDASRAFIWHSNYYCTRRNNIYIYCKRAYYSKVNKWASYYNKLMLVVDVNNLKNGRKPVKLQKENPAGCTGEGKQSKGN